MIESQKGAPPEMPDIDLAKLPNTTIGDIYVENPRMTARQVQVNYGRGFNSPVQQAVDDQ